MPQKDWWMTMKISGYDFEGPYTDTAKLKNVAGVYVVLCKQANSRWHVIDVGESGDVKDRIDNHDRKDCWKRNCQGTIGVAVLYTSGWTADQRRVLERKIRDEFSPPCGKR